MPTKRNYRKEYLTYQGTAIQKKRRALRNKARRAAIKAGKVRKGDSRDVDHKIPLGRGGSGKLSNTRVISRSANRAKNLGRGGRPKKKWLLELVHPEWW